MRRFWECTSSLSGNGFTKGTVYDKDMEGKFFKDDVGFTYSIPIQELAFVEFREIIDSREIKLIGDEIMRNKEANQNVIKHEEICKQLTETFEKKNHDYGNSFSKSYEELGIISAITRISDKYNRLVSLGVKNKEAKVNDEALEDTLLDMANYCIMTYMELTRKDCGK